MSDSTFEHPDFGVSAPVSTIDCEALRSASEQRDALPGDPGDGCCGDSPDRPLWDYRTTDLAVTVENACGTVARLLVRGRKLSAGGVTFRHGRFLPSGSTVRIALRALDGSDRAATGRVVYCRRVEGQTHEVGIRFDHPIDAGAYVHRLGAVETSPPDSFELPDLRGRIVYLHHAALDHRPIVYQLRATGVELTACTSVHEAVECLDAATVDIMLLDVDEADERAVKTIHQLRDGGFSGPLIVLVGDSDTSGDDWIIAAGADHRVPRPVPVESLIGLLIRLHQQVGAHFCPSARFSRFDSHRAMRSSIERFVDDAGRYSGELECAARVGDRGAVRDLCVRIRNAAYSAGFDLLAAAASDAMQVLSAAGSVGAAGPQVRRLALLCSHLAVRSGEGHGDCA